MNPLQRVLRPAARRILTQRLPLATTAATTTIAAPIPARRWQSNHGGPIDPVADGEMGVGELEGAKFRIEPLRRTGEDPETMRARLTYQSRKRGTLESDLLLSTFAAAYLPRMTPEQMREYDLFLDENDWDIYYWTTQPETDPTTAAADGQKENTGPVAPAKGEWAQTIGTFRPAYRPLPTRWKGSEILELLRSHVKERSAAGVLGNGEGRDKAEGMAFMPPLGSRK